MLQVAGLKKQLDIAKGNAHPKRHIEDVSEVDVRPAKRLASGNNEEKNNGGCS